MIETLPRKELSTIVSVDLGVNLFIHVLLATVHRAIVGLCWCMLAVFLMLLSWKPSKKLISAGQLVIAIILFFTVSSAFPDPILQRK